jgi:simple sugar transport system permease protein
MRMAQQAEPAVTTPPAPGPKETDGRTAQRFQTLPLLARPEDGVLLGGTAVVVHSLSGSPRASSPAPPTTRSLSGT